MAITQADLDFWLSTGSNKEFRTQYPSFSDWVIAGKPRWGDATGSTTGKVTAGGKIGGTTTPPSGTTGTMSDADLRGEYDAGVRDYGIDKQFPTFADYKAAYPNGIVGGKVAGTYPLPAGQQESYTDAQGYLWKWDTAKGDYNKVGYTAPKPVDKSIPLPAGQPQSYVDANGYTWNWVPAVGDYVKSGYKAPADTTTGGFTGPMTYDEQQAATGVKTANTPGTRAYFLEQQYAKGLRLNPNTNIMEQPATTSTKTYPLPPGQKESYVDAQGYTWTWDTTKGDYNQTGYTAPTTPIYNTKIVSDPDGHDYKEYYDSETGKFVKRDDQGKTVIPVKKAVIWKVEQQGGYDVSVGYDDTGKAVSWDPIGKTAVPKTGTQPLTQVVDGRTFISGDGGLTWQMVKDEPGKETYPLPSGWPQTYNDNAGNVKTYDPRTGSYTTTGSVTTPTDSSLGRPYNTYAEAKAAADATGGAYIPTQLTNGLWVLQLKEQPTTPTKPGGLWNTREEAAGAAGNSGYTPVQYSNGYWGLQEPAQTTPTRTYPQPTGFGGGTTQPSISDINAWILSGKGYNALYDINKDKAVNVGDVTAREMQPASGNTYADAEGNVWGWDTSTGKSVVIGYDPTQDTSRQMTDYQRQQLALQQQSMNQSSAAQAASTAQSAANLAWQQQQAEQELALQKQQHLADLAAHPVNWLQYSSESGIPAAIQPWMLPLQPGQYGLEKLKQPTSTFTMPDYSGIPSNYVSWENPQGQRVTRQPVRTAGVNEAWQVGQAIPGYTPENMKGMPSLLNPATQLYARMAPSMQQQYAGYQQAQTGATPEDTAWLLENQAPPSGRFGGLLRYRG